MLELAQSLTLNEEALKSLPENKRPLFVFEWLRFLSKVLSAAHRSDIKECQTKMVEQLIQQMYNSPGPPVRNLIGKNLSALYNVGDTFALFETINKCNDIIKSKDDSPSYLPTRLAATTWVLPRRRILTNAATLSSPIVQPLTSNVKDCESVLL